ncbi:hypothetical protein V8E36_006782 [Tilletia maclaganii]
MRLPLLSTVRIHAYNVEQHDQCVKTAYQNCGKANIPDDSPGWQIQYAKCISKYWRSLPSDGKCPYPRIGCHCYKGCVSDRYTVIQDVGLFCADVCNAANQNPRDCQIPKGEEA